MRDRLIELIKQVKFTPFKDGGGLDISVKHQLPDHAFEAIADHLLANGVIVPSCKVGDIVYAIARWHGNYTIREVEVCNYTIFDNEWKIVDPYGDYWSVNNFGKTVFLTREEAEKALKERSEG